MDPMIFGIVSVAVAAILAMWLLFRKGRWDPVSPHLRELPVRRLKYLLAGRFFLAASLGFMLDVLFGGGMPRTLVVALALLFGAIGATFLLLRRRPLGERLLIVLAMGALVEALAVTLSPPQGVQSPTAAAGYRFDAFAILATMLVGTWLYLQHINTEGARQLRAETELKLAHRLQQVLVPGVNFRNARLEVYGRAIPSDKVGGDLVDLITSENNTLVYLLDVSGHGIPAGALMGSLKTAIRIAFPLPMPAMLDQINRVLPSVKEPHMHATFGALAFEVDRESVEYTLAGHMPILHYRTSGEVERLACEQFPLGLLPVDRYVSRNSPCAPGDLFALYSDGIIEVANAADEQFGIERLESEIRNRTSQPLEKICDAVMAASAAHGAPDDDRSLLLIRVLS
jgi:serine phosphatase RsbU (regulator of sigma subunit)